MISQLKSYKIPYHFIFIFLFLAIGIISVGYIYYEKEKEEIKKDKQNELVAVADLKVNQIVNWRNERIGDAEVIRNNPFFANSVKQFFENPSAPILKKVILAWMENRKKYYQYSSAFLLDEKGIVRLSVTDKNENFRHHAQKLAKEAIRTKEVIFSDFHHDETANDIHLDIFVPLSIQKERNTFPVGVFLVRIDPQQYLYPLIQTWPTPSPTSEAMLVRREGNDVLFLNELRHRKNTALTLRLPESSPQYIAVKGVFKKERIVEGLDCCGNPALAVIRAVPDTPWFLISQIDAEEVYAPIRERAWLVTILVIVLIAAAGLSAGYILHNQRAHFYRKQYEAEHERQAMAERYSFLSKYANDSILLLNPDLQIVHANDRAVSSYGYTHEELLQLNLSDLQSSDTRSVFNTMIKQLEEQKGTVFETKHHRKNGSTFSVEMSSRIIEVGEEKFYQSIIRDITERKKAEKELEELSHRNQMILEAAGEGIVGLDMQGRIIFANPAAAKKTGYIIEELIGQNLHDLLHHSKPDGTPYPWEECPSYETLMNGADRNIKDEVFWRKDGSSFPVRYTSTPIREQGKIIGAVVTYRDITERKLAREALQAAADKYRNIFENAIEGIFQATTSGKLITANPAMARILGCESPEELIATYSYVNNQLYVELGRRSELIRLVEERGFVYGFESQVYRKDGSKVWISENICAIRDIKGQILYYEGMIEDITDRKREERELEAIVAVATALRTAPKRDIMLPIIIDKAIDLLQAEGAVLATRNSVNGEIVIELAKGCWANWTGARLQRGEGLCGVVIETGIPYRTNDIQSHPRLIRSELVSNIRAEACIPLIAQGQTIGALCIGRNTDISEDEIRLLTAVGEMAANAIHRATLHEQTERRMQRLSALHAIDMAITASLDLGVTLNILLAQVTTQLGVDAASVLLFNPHMQTLDYASGRGFHSHTIKQTRLHLGEGHAGRAALERKIVSVSNMRECEDHCIRTQVIADELFIAHYAIPLIAKGQVKGVLEIWHRSLFIPDYEWLGFMEALAAQAAIAIDNTELFNKLQRSNIELTLAYDATIAGWSRALDIRDKETEGHTQRVTEMTLHLARALGIIDAELVHVKRGALLHDIGKMGIPDNILFKAGPLNEEEWEIMRRHTVWAHEMISPISFLQPAIDIPYYHHEKWDGTGYPTGLKGEKIPLAARIFAVVDVWDALLSKRPYRPAWPREKALEYILEQAGIHFDPKVVEVFLGMISEKGTDFIEGP